MRTLHHVTVTGRAGLKGQRFTEPLSAVHFFAGPNGVGKSTRLQAILSGLRGLAGTPGDAGRVYLGERPDAVVTLDFGDVQVTRDLSAARGKAVAEADAQAALAVGNIPTAWDLADFASANDATRQQVLDQVVSAGGLLGGWTVERVKLEIGIECPPVDLDLDPLDELMTACDAPTPDAWLAAARAWYGPGKGTAFTTANAAASAAEAATQLHPADEEPPTGTRASAEARVAELSAEREAALLALRQVEARVALLERRQRDEGRHLAAVQRATEEVEAAESAVRIAREMDAGAAETAITDHRLRRQLAERNLANATKALDEAKAAANAIDLAPLETALAEARQEAAVARKALTEAETLLAEHRAAGETVRTARDGAAASLATLETLAGNLGGKGCAHCGGLDPLALGPQVEAARATLREADEALSQARERYARANSAAILAKATLRMAEDGEKDADRALSAARSKVDTLAREVARAEAAKATADQALADFPAEPKVSPPTLPAAQARLDRARTAQTQAEADLATWQAETAEPITGTDATEAQQALSVAEQLLTGAQAVLDAHKAHAQREADRQTAIAASARAAERLARVKAIGKAIDTLRDRLAQAAFGPITEAVDAFLVACGEADRFFMDDASTFGVVRGSIRIPFWSLSGSERAIVGAALAVAFARLGGSLWPAVVLDSMEAIEEGRRERVLAGLVAMWAEGRIAQAVCAAAVIDRGDGVADCLPEGMVVRWLGGGR